MSLDPARLVILQNARPIDGSIADGLRALIDIAIRADAIERQNADLSAALVRAMEEIAAGISEIRALTARLGGLQ